MGLSQDVSNTQTGSKVNSVGDIPVVKSNRSAAIQKTNTQAEAPASNTPDVKGASWKEIYSFVQNDDRFSTDKTYDEFVNTYASNEDKLRQLFTGIQLDTDFNSPFKSKSWNDFKQSEINNYIGYSVAPEVRAESAPEPNKIDTAIPQIETIDTSATARQEGTVDDLVNELLPREDDSSRIESTPSSGRKPLLSYKDLYNSVSQTQKDAALSEMYDFVGDNRVTNVKNLDNSNIYLNTDTKSTFGTGIKNTPSVIPPAGIEQRGTAENADKLFEEKIASFTGLPLNVVQSKKGEWALQSKMMGQYQDSEDDLLTDHEVMLRDRYAEQELVKQGNIIRDEYYKKASIASNGNPDVYWTKFSQSIESSFLTEVDYKIKKYKDLITELESKKDRSIDDEILLRGYKDTIEGLKGKGLGETLFDENGYFVSNKKVQFNRPDEVADKIEKYSYLYENTDKGILTKKRDDAFLQYVYAKRQYDQAVKDYESVKGGYTAPKSPLETGFETSADAQKKMEAYELFMEDRFANFYAMNRMILLNSDPGTQTSDDFFTGISEGFKSATNIVSTSMSANSDRAIAAIEEVGYELTDEQKNKISSGFWESAGKAVGQSIPVSVEIGFNIWLGNKAAGIAGVPRMIQAISGANKFKQFTTTLLVDSAIQSGAFAMSGESAIGGAGEGVGQTIASGVLNRLGLKGEALNFVSRWALGSTTETIAELSGQIMESWENNGFDFDKATAEVFGETRGEAIEAVATTFIVAMTLGVGGSMQESEWHSAENNDVWSLFLKEASNEIEKSDSNSPVVKAAKELNINEPVTDEEVKLKESVLEKKEKGEVITEEELDKSMTIATKEDVIKNIPTEGIDIEFDVTGIERPDVSTEETIKPAEKPKKVASKKPAPKKEKQVEKPAPVTKLQKGTAYIYNKKEVTVSEIDSDENGKVKSVLVTDSNGKSLRIMNTFKAPEAFDRVFTSITKPITDVNKEDKQGVSGKKQTGKKPVETKPIEKPSVEEATASGVVQAPEQVAHVEEAKTEEVKQVEEKKVDEQPATEQPATEQPAIERPATGVATEPEPRTEGTTKRRRKKQDSTGVEREKSSDKEVRAEVSEVPVTKKKQLTKAENEEISSMPEDKVEKLKERLNISSKTKSAKQVQREHSKNGGTVEEFLSAVEDVNKEEVSDYAQKRAEFDTVFNKAEALRKEGKNKEAISEYEKAKSILPEQSERIDTIIDIASSEEVDATSIKLKEEEAADEAAKAEEESVKNLEAKRSELVGTNVSVKNKKLKASGEVLSVNRISTDGEYEVLVDDGNNKTATKLILDKEGNYSIVDQDKSTKIANKSNFENSKERKTIINNKKNQSKEIEDITDSILDVSDRSGSEVALGRKDGTLNKSFTGLVSRIAYGKIEKVTAQYVSDLKSELNGLIKDSNPTSDQKVKRKIISIINSLSDKKVEKKQEADVSEEQAYEAAKKVETKKETKKQPKKATKKSTKSGNPVIDGITSRIDAIESEAGTRVIDFKKEMKPIYDDILALDKTSQEYLVAFDLYSQASKRISQQNSDLIISEKKKIKDINDEIKKNNSQIDEYEGYVDESYQAVTRNGIYPVNSNGRISARAVEVKGQKSWLKEKAEKYFGKTVTRGKMFQDLIDKVKVVVFEEKLYRSKVVDGKRVSVKPRWVGKFVKSENYIVIKGSNDPDTLIHEVGHAIAHRFGLNEAVNTGLVDSELSKLWEFGSNPPSKLNKEGKLNYKRQEGLAEFIRAYSINPSVASAQFPMLTKLYNDTVSSDVIKAVEEFGLEYSRLDASTDEDLMALLYNKQDYIDNYLKREKFIGRTIDRIKLIWNNRGNIRVNDKHGRIRMGWWTWLHTSIVEKTGALGATVRFIEKKMGKEFLAANNPYILIRNMSNFSQTKFKSLVEKGLVDKLGQRVYTDSGDLMNFSWLFEKMGNDVNRMADLVTDYLIAKNIVYEINEKGNVDIVSYKTGTRESESVVKQRILQIENLKNTNKAEYDAVVESAARWQEMALQTVKYRYESGLITKEQFDEISKNQDNYVALFRDMEQMETDVIRKKQKTQRKAQRLHAKKGSDMKIENPYASLLDLVMEAYYEGDKNHAVSNLANGLSAIGETFSSKRDDLKELQYFEDGELKTVFVSKDIAYVIDEMNSPSTLSNPIADKILSIVRDYIVGIPKSMITSTPGFMSKNILRDTMTRFFSSRYRTSINSVFGGTYSISKDAVNAVVNKQYISVLKSKKASTGLTEEEESALKELLRDEANSDKSILELYGGTMAGWYQEGAKPYYSIIKELKDAEAKDKKSRASKFIRTIYPGAIFRGYKAMLSSSENINRVAEFKKVFDAEYSALYDAFKSQGMSDTDARNNALHNARVKAAFEAKDLMDFTIAGSKMNIINSILMFANPAMQGWNRTAKTFRGSKSSGVKSILFKWVFWSAVAAMVESAFSQSSDDDDFRENMPNYLKDTFWTFKVADNSYFRVPKPFEFGLLSSVIGRGIDKYWLGKENAFDGFGETIVGTLPPVLKPWSILDNPFFQMTTNRDEFLDKDIVPYNEKDLDLSLRNTKWSSEFSKMIMDSFDIDPRKTDHFIRKTFSDWGDMFLSVTDNLAGKETPIIKKKYAGFFVETPFKNSKSYNDLQELDKKYGIPYNSKEYKRLNEIGDLYNNSKTDSDKEKYAEMFTEEAAYIVKKWESIAEKEGNLYSIGGRGTTEQKEEKASSGTGSSSRKKNRRKKR